MCQSHVSASIPRFHALTGCDSTSSISQLGKRKAWIVLKHSTYHQKALSLFVQKQYLDETILRKTVAFIRDLHPKTGKSTRTMDELQYLTVKMQKRGASTNFGQFEATLESRKLPNIYLEKLASSIARSTESKHHGQLSKTRILLCVASLITHARSHSVKAIALAPIQVSLVQRHACAWRTKCGKSRTLQRSHVNLVTQRRSQIFMTWRKTGKTE